MIVILNGRTKGTGVFVLFVLAVVRERMQVNDPRPLFIPVRGTEPDDWAQLHGHHIVMKNHPDAAPARKILEEYDIDVYTSPDNLMLAPNRGHSEEYALHVNELLRQAVENGDGVFEDI